MPEVAAAQTALVGDGADDRARHHLVPLSDADAVDRHVLIGPTRLAHGRRVPVVERPLGPFALLPRRRGRLGRHEERLAVPRLGGQRRGDVGQRHVVLTFVVLDEATEQVQRRRLERRGDRIGELGDALSVDVVDARQLHLGDRLTRGLLDRPEQMALARRDEEQRLAGAAGATGAADAVDVGLGVVRNVVVDDVRDAVDVESARGDVGGDEDVEGAALELADGPLALRLHDVAVDGGRRVAPGPQLLGEVLGGLLGADEDDHRLEVLDLEDAGEGVELALVRDLYVPLRDVRRGGRRRLHRDLDRVVHVLLAHLADRARHGGREQRDLLVLRSVGENALDVLLEAHLEHLVGLVEHQVLEVREVQCALLQVVDDPAGGADDDLRTAPQTGQLHAVSLAAVDRQDVQARDFGGVLAERLGHLQRELTRGGEDQRLRNAVGDVETREDGNGERRRLARARLRESDDVLARHQRRNGGRLNGRRGLVPHVAERREDAIVDAEIGEGLLGGRVAGCLVVGLGGGLGRGRRRAIAGGFTVGSAHVHQSLVPIGPHGSHPTHPRPGARLSRSFDSDKRDTGETARFGPTCDPIHSTSGATGR